MFGPVPRISVRAAMSVIAAHTLLGVACRRNLD
jgi:hypothetical protein